MSVLVEANQVAVRGPQGTLVEPVSLSLRAGVPLTIVGETGSGKSLLVQSLMGTLPEELRASGEAVIDGERFDLSKPQTMRRLWGRTIAILPQEPWLALDPVMRSREQVAEVHHYVRGESQASKLAEADLSTMGLSDARARLPGQLSGGMAQRLAFSAARAGGAHIQFADEPTKGLDTAMRDSVAELLLQRLGQEGGLLTVTHDLDLAARLGGEMLVMLEGLVIERGKASDLLAKPEHDYTKRLIAAQPSSWPQRATSTGSDTTVLAARGLSVERGGNRLFEGIDLDFTPGGIVGVGGPSGCGKTTLGNALLDLVPFVAGKVERDPSFARTRFQKLWQDPPSAFARKFAIGSEIRAVAELHGVSDDRLTELREKLRLPASLMNRLPGQVSGGELQRIAIMRALLTDPVFLFADEPTSRLDQITQQEVIGLLCDVVRDEGLSLLLVSHDSDLLSRTCDRVVTLGGVEGSATNTGTGRKAARV